MTNENFKLTSHSNSLGVLEKARYRTMEPFIKRNGIFK
jgi:hypothetical protein